MEKLIINFLITFFLGIFGVHKFLEGKKSLGFIYLFTLGIGGIGWIIDCIASFKNLLSYFNSSQTSNYKINVETNKKIRKSKNTFSYLDDDNRYLRYSYYDVQVKGIEHRSFDISKIELNHQLYFEEEPDNEYDSNAIKVLYNDIFIGYIPKNNLQSMMHQYKDGEKYQVCGFITSVNEENNTITIGLGFYKKITNEEFFDVTLTKTTKKDEIGTSRQENLSLVSIGDEVDIEYDDETETYIVRDCCNQLGEINKSLSSKLREYENEGLECISFVLNLDEDEDLKIICTIRIIMH